MTDRQAWLEERRTALVASYDAEAPTYDQSEYPTTSHPGFIRRLLDTCPPGGIVLDVPCGTGRWFAPVVASGRRVVGVDQSAGMLAQAAVKGAEYLVRASLHELTFDADFDGVMSIDGLENVFPEEWPVVLANLHCAVRPGGHLYLTIEEQDQAEIDHSFAALIAAGQPAVRGEVVEGDVAGYHYYPGRDQALRWIDAEGLVVEDEGFDQEEGWGYRHLLLRGRDA